MRIISRHARSGVVASRAAVAIAVATWLATVAIPVQSQESADLRRPNLDGHVFLPTDIIPDPFVRTYVRNTLGYASATNLEYPPIVFNGDTLATFEGSLSYAMLSFEYQQAIRDWIAVRVGFDARTRLGTEVSSLLLDGVTVGTDFGMNWMVRLHQSQSTMLSGSIGVTTQNFTRVDLKGFVDDVIADAPEPKLIDTVPVVQTTVAANFAWAISRPFGVTALLEGDYGESPFRDRPEGWEYTYGAAVDFDAGAAWDVPIGLALAFRQTSLPELSDADGLIGRTVNLRIAYNAQPDFIVGLDVLKAFTRESNREQELSSTGAMFTMRYYF